MPLSDYFLTEAKPVPILVPNMPRAHDLRKYLRRIDREKQYSNFGPLVTELESRLAQFLNVSPSRVVSVANASLGLMGTFITAPTDEWIISNWGFPATAQALRHSLGNVSLADISPSTWLPEVESPPTASTGLVVTVPFGSKVSLDSFQSWPIVVWDAAASLGNFDDLSQLGEAHAVVFSLHATKILGAGEGGCVVFGSESWAEAFRKWSNFGFSGSRHADPTGMNGKMSEYSAAVGLSSLDSWKNQKEKYLALRDWASETTDSNNALENPDFQKNSLSPYWIVLTETPKCRDQLKMTMSANQVDTREWWPQLVSDYLPRPPGSWPETPNCEDLRDRNLGLPFYASMPKHAQKRIELALRDFLQDCQSR